MSVEDLSSVVQYGSSAKTTESAAGIPVLRMGNIVGGRLRFAPLKYLPAGHSEFPTLLLEPGDVLFNRPNSPELVGKSAVYLREHPSPCSFASYLIRVRFERYEPALFAAYMSSGFGRAWVRSCVSQQVGQANVSGGKLKALELPVPPLNEQRRIVAKLDAVQACSRRAREALDAVPPLLEKLRQSILASAFRGDLTKDWRAQHPDMEPATELLQRIRLERRKKWEAAELAKMLAKSKPPSDDSWKAKYKPACAVDTTNLTDLPKGWCWASVDDVSDLQLGQQRAPIHAEAEKTYPYIRTANIKWEGLDLSDVKRMGFPDPERYRLRAGDVLLSEASGSASEVGKPAIWRDEIPDCCYQKTLLRARPVSPDVSSDWLYLCFLADALLGRFARMAPGVGILHLTADRMLSWPIALPPYAEQERLVLSMTSSLRAVATLEGSLQSTSETVAGLERAVLAKAFRGELVPQDPNDEPAEVMLARASTPSANPAATPTKPAARGGGRGRARAVARKDATDG